MSHAERIPDPPITLRSLEELGTFHGFTPPEEPLSLFDDYSSRSTVEKLQGIYDARKEGILGRESLTPIIKEVLEIDPDERERQGIRAITWVPLDDQRRIAHADDLFYEVVAVFPHDKKGVRRLSASNINLRDRSNSPEEAVALNNLVMENAEVYPETLLDLQNRHINQIKELDVLIKGQKIIVDFDPRRTNQQRLTNERGTRLKTFSTDQLNSMKEENVLAFLQYSLRLMEAYPALQSLFSINGEDWSDRHHRTLTMHLAEPKNFLQKIQNPRILPFPMKNGIKTTELNVTDLQQRRDSYNDQQLTDRNLISTQICEILGI